MRTKHILPAACLALAALVSSPQALAHGPRHGGVAVELRDVDYELVAKPTSLRLYVSDHGKAIKLDGAKAKLTLLSGAQKQEVDLQAAEAWLEAGGNFAVAKGTKAVAVVTLPGKPAATVRFVLP